MFQRNFKALTQGCLAALFVLLLSTTVSAQQELYNNGPLVNDQNLLGRDYSRLQNVSHGMESLGFRHEDDGVFLEYDNRVADDFVVGPHGWYIDEIDFYSYEIRALISLAPARRVNYQIWKGKPGAEGSYVVFGDINQNRLDRTVFTNVYRVREFSNGVDRPIWRNTVDGEGIYLAPGKYWIDWQTDGRADLQGPFAPPIAINDVTTTGNALVRNEEDWVEAVDVGTGTRQGFPFVIKGMPATQIFEDEPESTIYTTTFEDASSNEGDNGGWTTGGINSTWEFGTPTSSPINEASSPYNAWVTGLDNNYANNEMSWLQTPRINLGASCEPTVSFDIWRETENGTDGVQFQYSLDNGNTWTSLGNHPLLADPSADNWYNTGRVDALNDEPGWSGSSRGWETATHSLAVIGGEEHVLFRFLFASDDENTDGGFAVDNFTVVGVQGAIIGIDEEEYCTSFGLDTMTGYPEGGVFAGPGVEGCGMLPYAVNDTDTTDIPELGSVELSLDVTGEPSFMLGNGTTLNSVCFNIEHDWIGDLMVVLVSPNGDSLVLMDRPGYPTEPQGCSGDNVDACIVSGVGNEMEFVCNPSPGTAIRGDFTAHLTHDLAEFHNGTIDPNGTWKLVVTDHKAVNSGRVISWGLNFQCDQPAVFNPKAAGPGEHYITYEYDAGRGCMETASKTITVLPEPDAAIDPVDEFCLDGPIFYFETANAGDANGYFEGPGIIEPHGGGFIPAKAGLGNHTIYYNITDPATGCSNSDSIEIVVNPSPIVDAGRDTFICGGETIVLGGNPTAMGGVAPYTYEWLPNNPNAGMNSNTVPNPLATPTESLTYTLAVTDASGCTSTDEVVVAVGERLVVDAGDDQSICEGSSLELGGRPTASGAGPFTFAWSPATDLSSSSVSNPIASPSTSTTYTVSVTDVNGCVTMDEILVTVNETPIADAGNDVEICAGENVSIGGNPTGMGGNPPYTFDWNPKVGIDDPTLSNPVVNPNVTLHYTVSVIDARGCVGMDTVVVMVRSAPEADAGDDQVVCTEGEVLLGGSPVAGGGVAPYTYDWAPAGSLDDATAEHPAASPDEETTYTLTITDALGCTSTDEVLVRVSEAFSADAGSVTTVEACEGERVRLGGNPTAIGGVPPYAYFWGPNTGLSSDGEANPTATIDAAITYTVTVQDGNGCLATDEISFTTKPAPDVTFSNVKDEYCNTVEGVNFGANPVGYYSGPGVSADGATWNPGVAGLGRHTIVYNLPNVCYDVYTIDINVSVVQGPDVDAGSDKILEARGGSVTLQGQSALAERFEWSPASLVSDATSARTFASPTETTTFTLKVFNDSEPDCYATDTVLVTVNFDGNTSLGAPNTFTPNGDAVNDVFIIPGLEALTDNEVVIFNRWGQEVLRQTGYGSGNAWNGENNPEGGYFWMATVTKDGVEVVYQGQINIVR